MIAWNVVYGAPSQIQGVKLWGLNPAPLAIRVCYWRAQLAEQAGDAREAHYQLLRALNIAESCWRLLDTAEVYEELARYRSVVLLCTMQFMSLMA